MTPSVRKPKPTAARYAPRATLELDPSQCSHLPNSLTRKTGVREVLDILENIIAEGRRSSSKPACRNLSAHARAAVRHYADGDLRQAE